MPETTVTGPDGQEYVVTHPDGASDEQILDYAKRQHGSAGLPKIRSYGRGLVGSGEALLSTLGQGVQLALAGYGGLSKLPEGIDAAADTIRGGMDGPVAEFTAPRTQEGVAMEGALQKLFTPLGELSTFAGEGSADIAGKLGLPVEAQGAIGSAVKTGLDAGPMFLGKRLGGVRGEPGTLRERVLQRGQERGYTVPPSEVYGKTAKGAAANVIDSAAGKPRMQMEASYKNQQVTNNLAAESLDLPMGTEITRAALKKVRNDAGKDYAVLEGAGPVKADLTFRRDLNDARLKANKGSSKFQTLRNAELDELNAIIDDIRGPTARWEFGADDAIGAMQKLRERASTAYDAGNNTLGAAYRGVSNALENLAERHLARTMPDAVESFRNARQRIAKSYTIEEALVGDGVVSAPRLAKAKADGVPLDDSLMLAADMAEQFPKATRVMKDRPIAAGRISTLAAAGGGGATVAGSPAVGLPLALAALSGYPLRAMRLSQRPVGPQTYPLATPLGLIGTELVTDKER